MSLTRRIPATSRAAVLEVLLGMRAEGGPNEMISRAVAAGLALEEAAVLVHHNVYGGTASEIVSLHPDLFTSCEDVYRVSRLLLENAARLLGAAR